MIESAGAWNMLALGLTVVLPALGISIGQGIAGYHALQAIDVQPAARNEISNTLTIGMALTETASVLGVALAIFMLVDPATTWHANVARMGIALAFAPVGLVTGIVAAWLTQNACYAIARQPFFSQKILNLLLLTQSLLQTPTVFAFIIAWFIKTQSATSTSTADVIRLLMSGVSIGIGSIGPLIGLALFARSAIESVGINRKAYASLLMFTFISQAIIETAVLLAFIISIILLMTTVQPTDLPTRVFRFIASGLCMGIGTLFPSISSGKVAGTACKEIAHAYDHQGIISRTSLFAQFFIDTFIIYIFVVSILLLVFA